MAKNERRRRTLAKMSIEKSRQWHISARGGSEGERNSAYKTMKYHCDKVPEARHKYGVTPIIDRRMNYNIGSIRRPGGTLVRMTVRLDAATTFT